MTRTAEFFFDVGSPTAYLAWTQLPTICAQTGSTLVYKPMLLGGVFQATGNAPPGSVPQKGRYMGKDIARFAKRYGVPLAMNPHFPINTLTLMRALVGIQQRQPERFDAVLTAVFNAMWVAPQNLNEPALAVQVFEKAGFAAADLMALVSDAEVKAALKANTEEAVQRGVFGAPTVFVGDEMFFGQDRLDFVKEALMASA